MENPTVFLSVPFTTQAIDYENVAPAAQLAIRDACCYQPNLSLTRSLYKSTSAFHTITAIDA